MLSLRIIAVVVTLGLLAGVALTLAFYLGAQELTRQWAVGFFFAAVISALVATAGLNSRVARIGTRDAYTAAQIREIVRSAPRWTVLVLVAVAVHLLIMGTEGLAGLLSARRTRIEDADPAFVLGVQSLAVLIQSFGLVAAWSAIQTHWTKIDLQDASLDEQDHGEQSAND